MPKEIRIALVDLDDCEALYGSSGTSLANEKLHAHLRKHELMSNLLYGMVKRPSCLSVH